MLLLQYDKKTAAAAQSTATESEDYAPFVKAVNAQIILTRLPDDMTATESLVRYAT